MFHDSVFENFGFERSRSLLALVLTSLMAMGSAPAGAEPLSAGVQWKDPSSVRLEVDFPGNGYHASWDLYRCACGDLMIRSELNVPGEVVQGDIVLVGNRAVLLHGYDPKNKEQISLDAPALMMQLALRLLERATPAGPSVVTERTEVAVQDDINFINLDTGAAAGGFPPPWSVTGSIWPEGDSERRFELEFSFNTGGAAAAEPEAGHMKLSGLAQYAAGDFPLAPEASLAEWELSWRDESDPAAAKAEQVRTLAELRQLLQEN